MRNLVKNEGMELEVLAGSRETIGQHRPILVIENLKTDPSMLQDCLADFGYQYFALGMNMVAFHPSDPSIEIETGTET